MPSEEGERVEMGIRSAVENQEESSGDWVPGNRVCASLRPITFLIHKCCCSSSVLGTWWAWPYLDLLIVLLLFL